MGQIDLQSKFRSLSEVVREVQTQFDANFSFIQGRLQLFEIELESGKLGIDRLEQSVESTILLTQAFLSWILLQQQNQTRNLHNGLEVASIQIPTNEPVSFEQGTVDVQLQTPHFTTQQNVLVAIGPYGNQVQFNIGNVIHGVSGTTEEPQPRSCSICFKEFTDASKLRKHMSLTHANAKLHRCRACDERFPSVRALKLHVRKEHPGSNQKEEVEVYRIGNQLDSAPQQELQDLWQQNLICSVCSKKFSTPRKLRYHEKIHQDLPRYKCKTCGKEFKLSKYLREHVRTHSVEKPYPCDTCGRNFKSWGSRYSHSQTHKDAKRFSCQHCDKTFIRADGLKRHLIVHTKNKPFACEFCRKPFTLKNSLIAHVEKFHREHVAEPIVIECKADSNDVS